MMLNNTFLIEKNPLIKLPTKFFTKFLNRISKLVLLKIEIDLDFRFKLKSKPQ